MTKIRFFSVAWLLIVACGPIDQSPSEVETQSQEQQSINETEYSGDPAITEGENTADDSESTLEEEESSEDLYRRSKRDISQWKPTVITFKAWKFHQWYSFPLQVTFTHADSNSKITVDGYWNGGKVWNVRFAPTQAGTWNWKSSSSDSGLGGKKGSIYTTKPSATDKVNNPNLRGHLKITADHRRLAYADGTPLFWLGDTCWLINAARCGIDGKKEFYTYVDNRKNKQFNVIQIQYFGHSEPNEGGYPFPRNTRKPQGNGRWNSLNPKFFQKVDTRMNYLFNQGFVIAGHPSWFSNSKITLAWAKTIMRYLLARYGAYNTVWSLTGEYQFSRRYNNSLKSPGEWNQLGKYTQTINPYSHPVTIHPTYGKPNKFEDYSSSGEFHKSKWLNINWIQTYSYVEDVSESVYNDYKKMPKKPVIMAEPGYEFFEPKGKHGYRVIDGMLSRLQAWSSILSGAAGHTYGAWGVWQFDNTWSREIDGEGASDMQHIKTFFEESGFDWTTLEPCRNCLLVNNKKPTWPSSKDFTPPHCAAHVGKTYVAYIPEGNRGKRITLKLPRKTYKAYWYNPRNGKYIQINAAPSGVTQWNIPSLPDRSDWVLLVTAQMPSRR